ncbi:hypothetical protein C5L38_35500 (plasmid) [Streptomyces sp. WAC00288]|uniref:hypothetical protein n=1 Tax=unclassified Streptomyces TaxID=2593676 RepID=UPI000786B504|nr:MULTISPECIES: hypothetical protein [unclassified Streptomyces]AVI00042.1 hypothetical protein C5L38_33720 [Streptomyces sp. WAC00288]AVI00341.1 hypothetical protein C5L38_35500 [Streptomyces sp. WAC00288]KYG51106.1 hypothetical protein AWI43_32145 [Streptomyces sp. WAC04657]
MPVLRRITTCTAPSVLVVERATQRPDRPYDYRLQVCRRHRWLIEQWHGRRTEAGPDTGVCGEVLDHRDYLTVVRSHVDLWLRPLTFHDPDDHDGDLSRALTAGYELLIEHREPTGVAVAIGHAARITVALKADELDVEAGRTQVLAALSVAETLDAASRGA